MLSEELRDAAGLDMLTFCTSNGLGLHSVEHLRKLLYKAAAEIDRLNSEGVNKSAYEAWMEEKRLKEME